MLRFLALSCFLPQVASANWSLTYEDLSEEAENADRFASQRRYDEKPEAYWDYLGRESSEGSRGSILLPPIAVAATDIELPATEEKVASPGIPVKATESAGKWTWTWTGRVEGYTAYRFEYDIRARAQATASLWIDSPEKGGYGSLEARARATVSAVNAREYPHTETRGFGVGVRVVEDKGGSTGEGGGPGPIAITWGPFNKKESRPSITRHSYPIMISGVVDAPGSACFIFVSAWASILSGESKYRGETSQATASVALDGVDSIPVFHEPVSIHR